MQIYYIAKVIEMSMETRFSLTQCVLVAFNATPMSFSANKVSQLTVNLQQNLRRISSKIDHQAFKKPLNIFTVNSDNW